MLATSQLTGTFTFCSKYWTALRFSRSCSVTYRRVFIIADIGFDGAGGGMTVYYIQHGLTGYQ